MTVSTIPPPFAVGRSRPRPGAGARATGALLALAGLGSFGLWIASLARGAFGELPAGLFVFRDGSYPAFHLAAEALMGTAGIAGGVALWRGARGSRGLALLAMGMFAYAVVNNGGWAVRDDPSLLIPMGATLLLVVVTAPGLIWGRASQGKP